MSNEDKIKELFAEKLGNLEAPVNPELWSTISSQIGTATTVTSTSLSIVAKTIIGISAASVIGVGTYFLTRNTVDEQTKTEQITQVIDEKNSVDEKEHQLEEVAETTEMPNFDGDHIIITKTPEFSYEFPKPLIHIDLLDNSTFTNEPTQNLIGETPTEAPTQNNPVVSDKTTTKQDILQENNTISPVHVEQPVKASFEITRLPNIYGLYAGGHFSIDYSGEYTDFQITIMDSRNNVIFSSDRPDFEWRGTDMSGNQVEAGKYVYIITAKDVNGNAVNKYSPLNIINQ